MVLRKYAHILWNEKEGDNLNDELRKYKIVKKYVDKMDYYELLSGIGAPEDEFDGESKEIAYRINKESTACEIAEVMREEFNSSFGDKNEVDFFMKWAQEIKDELVG